MKKFICLLLFAVVLSSCSPVSVDHAGQLAPENMEIKGTYGWLENSIPSNDIRVNNAAIDEIVKNSVEKRLSRKGYVKVVPAQADYLITWFGTITEEMKEISLNRFYATNGYGTLAGSMPENIKDGKVRKTFSRGTLILDVLDREGKKVLWRGSATNTLRESMNAKEVEKYIDASVAKILEKLPKK